MKKLGWGNLRINFQTLLIAFFCIQISSSFAVADPVNPTNITNPTTNPKTYVSQATQTYSATTFNPSITSGEDIVINGDNGNPVGIYNSITDANSVTMKNVTISFVNNEIFNYTFNNLTINDDVDFMLDVDLANSKSDNITTTNSTGTVKVSTLNFLSAQTGNSTKFQVIKNSGLALNIDLLQSKLETEVKTTMYNDTVLADSITLGQTSFANDSIVITGWKDVLYELIQDSNPIHTLKNFVFRTDSEYTVTKDLGTLGQESILAISNESTGDYGVLNANGHSLFKLSNPISKVTLDNIYVKNASTSGNGSVASLDNNTATFTAKNSVITNNKSNGNGGAFYVKNGTLKIENSTVSNNTSNGNGGAIYTESNVEIIADDAVTEFYSNTAGGESNAIYVGSKEGTVNLTAKNNGTINMNDKINGTTDGYKLNVNGDSTGKINLNNTVKNATIQLNGGVLTPSIESNISGNNFIGNGGMLNLINNSTGTVQFNEVTMIGNTKLGIDADLRNNSVDKISGNILNASTGKLSITNINVISDSIPEKITVAFANGPIKDAIRNAVSTVYSRIYKYKVSYNKSTGQLTFNRGGGDSGGGGGGGHSTADIYNPVVLASGVAQQIAYANQLQNYQTAMYHSDSYMMLPKLVRNMRNQTSLNLEDEFKNCSYYPYQGTIQDEIKSIWVRPYSTFESIPLKRGVSVSNISYGTLFGGDSDMISLGHGFNFVYGGYVGYNGNSTSYSHIDASQQGAVVGLNAYLYKGNFFNAITANCGWQINESFTNYGTDTMNLIMSGVADRVGYNFELASGKLILQPSIFFGYSFVYSTDYTTSNGVHIKSDPLNVIHFAPTLKVIGNLTNGWQPYLLVSVIANFIDKTNFTADNIKLPQMSIDPYVEYGIGIQRRWGENCQGFGQATVRNGGRRGVAILFGFKYMMGKLTGQPTPVPADRITDKKVKFKDRKAPDIEIVDWRTAKKQAKQNRIKKNESKPLVAKTGFREKLKNLKKFLTFKYNTDVSAKVVSDTYSDGVIITTLKGQNSSGEYSTYVDMDMQEDFNPEQKQAIENLEPEGVIIIEDTAFAHKQQTNITTKPAPKPVEQVQQTVQQVQNAVRKSDLIKRINKKYAKIFKINQTNYIKPVKQYEFKDYTLEIIKF